MIRPSWWEYAECLGVGCSVFFPPPFPQNETPAERRRREEQAKTFCRRCDVRSVCLKDALATGDDGVRGGTTQFERKRMVAPLPTRRNRDLDPNWTIVVNRPRVLAEGVVRMEQNNHDPTRYRIVTDNRVISEHDGELEAWIGLHKAT